MEKLQAEGWLEGSEEYEHYMDIVCRDEAVLKFEHIMNPPQEHESLLEEEVMEGGEALDEDGF